MEVKYLSAKDLLYIISVSLALGVWLAFIHDGNRLIGFISFSFLFLLSFTLLKISRPWRNSRTLGFIVALAFFLRLAVGLTLHLALPIYGHEDEEDKAGYVFTDAYRRDRQAWELASSERPLVVAFTDKFAYDQYGGLLAFAAFIYRYLSPDAHRPLMLVLLSAFVGTLSVPFLWRATERIFNEKVAFASAWIFALYPEAILLGSSAMREPYLLMFSAFALWGFINWSQRAVISAQRELSEPTSGHSRKAGIWLGVGLLGMLLVSPAVALVTLLVFVGWMFFTNERRSLSWKIVLIFAVVLMLGLFFLSASLNRSGEFDSTSPLHVVNDWLRLAVKWNAYQIERESGWVQKLFDEMPEWMRLPFVAVYGIFQPVLPAALVAPTKLIWKTIYLLRSLGWYALLPLLVLSFVAAAGQPSSRVRNLVLWLSLLTWTWILLAALRGGGDLWDNPRYRTILFLWQALIAGYVWVWWRETHNLWFVQVLACEVAFIAVFTQWYASRYFHWGGQLPFGGMILLIVGLWVIILGAGWWQARRRA
ncbi:MAG TPA: hypothetical protein VFZ43_08120 [Anaerolineales bacterium]